MEINVSKFLKLDNQDATKAGTLLALALAQVDFFENNFDNGYQDGVTKLWGAITSGKESDSK